MIKHIVLWKIRDDDDKQKNIDHMIKILTALVGKVEGLVSMEMGYNFNENADYDVVLYATFKNPVALKYYQTHPEHLKCVDFVKSVAVNRVSADYFYESETTASKPFDSVPDAPDNFSKTAEKPARSKFAAAAPPHTSKKEVEAIPVQPPYQTEPDNSNFSAPVKTSPAAPPPPPISEPPAEEKKTHLWGKKAKEEEVFRKAQQAANNRKDVPNDGTWTCPSCGKVMPKYVGTCGCGETQPLEFDDMPPMPEPISRPKSEPISPPATAVNAPAPEKKTHLWGKKAKEEEVFQKAQQAANNRKDVPNDGTWTCPSCGKVMPKYVGTCGCGETQPLEFDDMPPMPEPVSKPKAEPISQPAPAPEKKKPLWGKKAKEEEVFQKAQQAANNRKDVPNDGTWTCPNCGKVMPKYVGTCGCGETQPLEFNDEPFSEPASQSPAAETSFSSNVPKIRKSRNKSSLPNLDNSNIPEEPIDFNEQFENAAPSIQSYNPQIPQEPDSSAQSAQQDLSYIKSNQEMNINNQQAPPPFISPDNALGQNDQSFNSINFGNVPPPSPMTFNDAPPQGMEFGNVPPPAPMTFNDAPPQGMDFGNVPPPSPMTFNDAPPQGMGFGNVPPPAPMTFNDAPPQGMGFGNVPPPAPMTFNDAPPQGMGFGNVPPPAPMTFNDAPPQGMDFGNVPPPSPMTFNDAPPQGMDFGNVPPPSPMTFNDDPPPSAIKFDNNPSNDDMSLDFDDVPPAAPMTANDAPPASFSSRNTASKPKFGRRKSSAPANGSVPTPVPTPPPPAPAPAPAPEKKKHLWGKKAKEEEVFQKAQQAANNRKDVPNDGNWTCPNCGKVMPKYVGTCGCGEPQPFED